MGKNTSKEERNTPEEMLQIIEALISGKKVQFKHIGTNCTDKWNDYECISPDFFSYRFRIKPAEPQKKWRPFKDTAELFAHNNGHNILWLKDITKNKADCWTRLVTLYSESTIAFDTDSEFTMEGLLENFTFADGTPCGVLVEEDA